MREPPPAAGTSGRHTAPFMERVRRRAMTSAKTIEGLQDTLDDLEKQLEKAEEKYETLKRRRDAVHDALRTLNTPEPGSE